MDGQSGAAGFVAVKIGDGEDDGVARRMDIGQGKNGVGRAEKRRTVKAPLKIQRRRAGSIGDKGGVAAAFDGLVRERGDCRRQHHGQHGHAAGAGTKIICDEHIVTAAAVRRDGTERENVAGRAGNSRAVGKVRSVFAPLINERNRAARRRAE